MAGIIDFITDMGGDRDLGGEFVEIISQPDCTKQDLASFFTRRQYTDVTQADVDKLFSHRNNIAQDYGLVQTDY
jgi:hypothetical protein